MTMTTPRHYFEIKSRYGPADLFKTLMSVCEDPRFKKVFPSYGFDWIKRKVEISAATPEGVEELLEELIKRVNRKAGKGMLLPGERVKKDDGYLAIPIGVLLQTPDVYAEVVTGALREFGVRSIQLENEGDGFSIPLSAINRALEYEEVINSFPLPDYLSIKDKGISSPSSSPSPSKKKKPRS